MQLLCQPTEIRQSVVSKRGRVDIDQIIRGRWRPTSPPKIANIGTISMS
jgi:hypothetical protein